MQTNIKSFLRRAGRAEPLPVFGTIEVRDSEPQPFTQVELERLISAAKARGEADLVFIETACSLGRACTDMVHLTKDTVSHSNGVMMYKRHKLRKKTKGWPKPRIHPARREKLLNTANESGYIFWNGKTAKTRAIIIWITRSSATTRPQF